MKKYADFEKLGNDMFWSIFCHKKISWHGYDDENWWNNVENNPVRACTVCHKKYELDFKTNELKEIVS